MAASFVLELDLTAPVWTPLRVTQDAAGASMFYEVSEPALITAEVLESSEPVMVFGDHLVLPVSRGTVRVTARDDVLNQAVYEVEFALDFDNPKHGWVGQPRTGFARYPSMGYVLRRVGAVARATVGRVARATIGRIAR